MSDHRFFPIQFTRGGIFTFEEFLHSFDARDSPKADFSYITGQNRPVGQHSFIKRTAINDLRGAPESILKCFNESTRNYIHSVMKNDLCIHEFITAPTESEVLKVNDFCNDFSRKMGIKGPGLKYLLALRRSQRLHISYVYDHNKVLLSGHGYRLSPLRPELIYSIRAIEPGADKDRMKILSKANRYSHYCDMLEFKSQGYEEYDFGGLSDGQSDNIKWKKIDEFKLYFGGAVRAYHNSILYNTWKGKTYLMVRGSPFR